MSSLSKLRPLAVILAVIALISSSVVLPLSQFTPAANAAEDTQRIDMSISTLEHLQRNEPERWEYWSGEQMTPVARFEASGTAVDIHNARITLKVKKSQYLERPKFIDSANADRSTKREDAEAWYVDYEFNNLRGGTAMDLPFPMLFKNKVTPNGTVADISWTLYDGTGSVIKEVERQITAKAQQQYTARKGFYPGDFPNDSRRSEVNVDGQRIMTFNYPVEDVNAVTDISQLRPQGFVPVTYWIGYRYTSPQGAPAGTGEYEAQTVRFTENLPEGARLSEQAIRQGWTYTDDTQRVATRTMPTSSLSSSRHCGGKCVNLTLDFYTGDINKDGSSTRQYKPYANTVQVMLDPEGVQVDAGTASHSVAFGADEKPKFPGKTRSLNMNKARYANEYTYFANDIYHDTTVVKPNGQDGQKMGYYLEVYQTNNGSQLDGPKRDGLTDTLTEIIDENLDERFFFSSIILNDVSERNGSAITRQEQRARVEAAKPHVYGVAADGSETKLSSTPLKLGTANRLFINDEQRQYEKLIIRFDEPLIMDNLTLRFGVEVFPRASEIQKWEQTKYADSSFRATYGNRMKARTYLTSNPAEDTSPTRETYDSDNTILIAAIRPMIYNGMSGSNTVPYENCEKKLPEGTPYTPQNCGRVKEYTYTSTGYDKWGGFMGPVKNLRQVILLPSGVNYVKTQRTARNLNLVWDKTPLEPKVVPNFNNTGKTALVYEWGDVSRERDKHVRPYVSFTLDTSLYAEPGVNEILAYTLWDNNDLVTAWPNNAIVDTTDMDGDGNTTEKFLVSRATTNFVPPAELVARKSVSLDKGAWFLNAPAQDLGGTIYYRHELRNSGITPISTVQVLDVLPHLQDRKIVANQAGEYLPRKWDKVNEDGTNSLVEHSSFTTPLSGPVQEVTAQNGNTQVDAKNRFDYFYSTVPQGDTIEDVRTGQWLTEDQVSDWSTIRNFKAVLKPGMHLEAGEIIRFVTPHTIPYTEQNRALASGSRSVNSLASSRNGVNFIEANEVTSEIIKYSVKGTVFRDVDHNGNLHPAEDRLAGYTVKLINADTGAVATTPDGSEITAETDARGQYNMVVYNRGKYRVEFTKKDKDVFTTVGTGAKDVAHHVTSCYEAGSERSGATADMCGAANSGANTLGLTDIFNLSPTNREETRNAGVLADKRNVEIRKVDQDGNKLSNGIQFRMCFTGGLPGQVAPPIAPHTCQTVAVTDGVALFQDMHLGNYTLEELNVPAGIEGLTTPLHLSVTRTGYAYADNGDPLPYLTVTNNLVKATVTVKKVDVDHADTTLEGAVFTLTNTADRAKTYTSNTTTGDGIAVFTNIPYGDYELSEQTAPTNYNLSTEKKTVKVRKHLETVEVGAFTNAIFKGSIRAKKVDADTNEPIAGATFGLLKVAEDGQETKIAEQASNPQGIIEFTNVPFGTYRIAEITPAEGYLATTVKKDASIARQGQVVDLTSEPFTNTIKKGSITLKKVDFDNTATVLEGVTFALYAQNGNVVADQPTATAVTNGQGVATFSNVRYGTYVVRETATKDGYALESGDRSVSITADGQVVDLKEITNKLIVGTIKVKKVNDEDPARALSGVKFGLFPTNNGTPSDAPVAEATTGEDGIAQFDRVTKGTYEIRETATIAGHNLNTTDKRLVTISTRDQVEDLTTTPFINTRIRGDVLLKKVDAKTPAAPLQGVEFGLFAKSDDGNVATTASYTAQTGADGTARFAKVLFGKYQLKEITPKLGYNPSSEVDGREVVISTEGQTIDLSGTPFVNKVITSTVKLIKRDADTPTMLLGGVQFKLYPVVDGVESTTAAYTAQTGVDGVATFDNVEFGSYKLRETQPLTNYVPTAKAWDVHVVTEGATILVGDDAQGHISNTLKKGSVTLKKVDADTPTKPLKGVTFVLKQGAEEKYSAVSDDSGIVRFTDVVYGEYTAAEKETLANYNLRADWTATVNIDADKKNVDLGTVTNTLKKGKIVVNKVSADDNNAPLKGARFALKQGDVTVAEGLTDDMGSLTFDKVIYGDYTLVETQAPEGFVLEAKPVAVSINEEGQVITAETFSNQAIRGSIILKKIDAKDKAPLEGVEFELVHNDQVVDTASSDTNGAVLFQNVRYGTYTIREKAAPEGYVPLETTFPVTISTDKQTVDLSTVENRRIVGEVVVRKIDAETSEALEGVEFALYPAPEDTNAAQMPDLAEEPAYSAKTDQAGIARFEGVEYGTWTLVERSPIDGYNPSEETRGRTVTIEKDGAVVDAGTPFTNTKIRSDITLLKVDPTGKPLAGATFALRDADGKTIAEATSQENGLVIFERVAYGEYTVIETAAPKDYQLNKKVLEAKVSVEGQRVDLGRVINEPIPVLASTGAQGMYAGITASALALGALLLAARRRRA